MQLPWKHQFEFAGHYAAIEQGYYADEGLAVELREIQPGQSPVDEVLSGRAQFGVVNSELVLDRLQGKPVVLLANIFKTSPLVLLTQPDILSPQDLRGKRVMASAKELESAPFASMFRYFGLEPDSFEQVAHSYDLEAFLAGEVDAVTVFLSNQMHQVRSQQIPHSILNPSSFGVSAYDDNLFSSEHFLRQHPGLVEGFVRATLKGWHYALDHKEELVDLILRKYSQRKSREALLFEAQALERLTLRQSFKLGSIDPQRIDSLADLYVSLGNVASKGALQGFIRPPQQPLALTLEEQQFLVRHPVIRIAQYPYGPLLIGRQGKPDGYAIEFLKLLAAKAGLQLEFVTDSRPLQELQAVPPQLDLVPTAGLPAAAGALLGSPYLELRSGWAVRSGLKALEGLADLAGMRVAVVHDGPYAALLAAQYPAVRLVDCRDIIDCLERTASGQADAVIDALPVLEYHIRKYAMPGLALKGALTEPALRVSGLRLASRADWPQLHSILEKAQASLGEDELAVLRKRWFGQRIRVSDRLTLSDWENNYLLNRSSLHYCVDPDWLPYEGISPEGEHIGMTADYVALFRKLLNVELKLLPTSSWSQSLHSVYDRDCDLLLSAAKTAARTRHLYFTEPYLEVPLVVATRDDQLFIDDMKSVLDKRFAVIMDYAWIDLLQQRYPQIQLVQVDNIREGLQKVSSGELFGFIDGVVPIARAIQQYDLINLKIAGKTDISVQLSVALRNDAAELLSIFNKLIGAISPREREAILQKWVAVRYERGFDYSLMWQILAVLAVIGSLLFYRHLLLARQAAELRRAHQALREAHAEIAEQNRNLAQLSTTDTLTGLSNRLKLDRELAGEVVRAERYQRSLSLLLIDIDHFKQVNDSFGHQTGDEVICRVADALNTHVREADVVGRWGGEEFLVLCPETSLQAACGLAEKLRRLIEACDFAIAGQCTASIGVAAWRYGEAPDELMKRADDALYLAKGQGRNRVVCEDKLEREALELADEQH
ncbi:transporter substrate-binding domain-containing protein [Marinobacterium sp. CAU 1594]|nr:transporter substrate-binding domain-containing protein [Marinobacterium arenosum]